MELNYSNYLVDKVDSKFLSRNTLVNLGFTRQNELRNFEFTLEFQSISIQQQANMFAMFISGRGIFENSFLNNANRINSATQLVANAYIYSYLKTIYYAHCMTNKDISGVMGPGSNLVFHGHKILHDIICEGSIIHFSPPSNALTVELNLPENTLEQLKLFPLWNTVYNEGVGRVYNQELETVLSFLHTKANSLVRLGNLSSSVSPDVKNLLRLPIGNLCLSKDMMSLLYVEDKSLNSDKISFYWNKANLISIVTVPFIDADDEIYDTIPHTMYDTNGLSFEVQAITGFNPLTDVRSNYDYTSSSPSGDSPNVGGGYSTPPPSGNPNRSRGNGAGSSRARGTNPRSGRTKLEMVRDKVSKLSDQVVSVVRQIDEVMTPDRVEFVADIIQQITGKRPRIKTLRQHVGERLGKVLEENGILLNDRLSGSNEEYDAFYAETAYINGKYKTDLVGTVKQIAPK